MFKSNCYSIRLEEVCYYKSTSFGERHSFRIQFKLETDFLHFEFSNKLIWKRLVNQFNYWLEAKFVPLDESMLPSEKIIEKVVNGKWPVFGTTKKLLQDADTLNMISRNCARMAKQLVDAMAICLLIREGVHDDYLIGEYLALKKQFIASKEGKVVPKKNFQNFCSRQVLDLQWRYGLFDLPY